MAKPAPRIARVTRILFALDMTRPAGREIPLGILIEAVWPGEARWLGLVGRTALSPRELAGVNVATWPELRDDPFALLEQKFKQGWAADPGDAGAIIAGSAVGSALVVTTMDKPELLRATLVATDAAWRRARQRLNGYLLNYGKELDVDRPARRVPQKRVPAVARTKPAKFTPPAQKLLEESAPALC